MRVGTALGLSVLVLSACAQYESVPETGRRRVALRYTEEEMSVLGAEAYMSLGEEYKTITGTPEAALVRRVGQRIARASGKKYDWEFRLFDEPKIVNAFCLPGGKIGVFSGILPITQNENGMAVVLGHEVAHATLQHSNERMSQPAIRKLIGLPVGITVGVWGMIAPRTRRLVMSTFGLGHVVGEFLPYSQEHELEADDIGLLYMQKAGYDVREAPRLWRRLAKDAQEKGVITDSISTHPDPELRAERLEQRIRSAR